MLYEVITSILTLKATQALKNVQEVLNKKGYSLLIYDAYRPTQAVESFVQWTQNPSDIQVKEIYYPDLDKTQLVITSYSIHYTKLYERRWKANFICICSFGFQ